MWKTYIAVDDTGSVWIINSPNANYASLRITELIHSSVTEIRELTKQDESDWSPQVRGARAHRNFPMFAQD